MTAPAERADAARNRLRILDAARRRLTADGSAELSLDAVAKDAGVGVGTVYRRFHNRAGLVYALIEDNESRFQEEFARRAEDGSPPARERLRAFLHGMADLVENNRALLLLAEASVPAGRYRSAPFRRHHEQVVGMVAELAPDADAAYLADLLLMAYTPGLFDFQRTDRGWDVDRIKRGLDALVAGIGAVGATGAGESGEPAGPPPRR
ncbi:MULTISPECIES: TetR/AcrR family transcriptional regulator [unclassified Streptomyces]|uniref:TetR/AcrR family transcriptional regulator n=1 Tax=unclassified Streptomyces TaxID=2593676 RepID=UPI0006FC57EA|nr:MULTISPECIES: TetR/AcrR family transcriptional regulator [unclassified Streptomyces]KQX50758.1 TetR family transcriptional regulator [Streptomyces sp. Root1304]KRA84923.1 TetR family transcriptional regulator [Streptomyces sp. Root66D1]